MESVSFHRSVGSAELCSMLQLFSMDALLERLRRNLAAVEKVWHPSQQVSKPRSGCRVAYRLVTQVLNYMSEFQVTGDKARSLACNLLPLRDAPKKDTDAVMAELVRHQD